MRLCLSRFAAAFLALILGGATGSASAEPLRFSTVVIDAGHGGKDGGSAWNGLIEKKLCLDVARRVETGLKSNGLKTLMTRRTDAFVALEQRARIANRVSSSVFVSIHFNGSRKTSIAGSEVYYRSPRGKAIATSLGRSLKSGVPGATRGVFYGDYKVLRETDMPAVLVECGYLSNKREARRCADPVHRQKLADAIIRGLLAVRTK
ncbi:N-acetylmuramoyl-L-alanine amidase [Prosthecobacter sp.]|uniref:N-acetylmuramoyl-L-alanine amidase n=1 Tax=Prosthecobacter sp. TaxID=1965333 RepID=UPI0037851E48